MRFGICTASAMLPKTLRMRRVARKRFAGVERAGSTALVAMRDKVLARVGGAEGDTKSRSAKVLPRRRLCAVPDPPWLHAVRRCATAPHVPSSGGAAHIGRAPRPVKGQRSAAPEQDAPDLPRREV